MKLITGFLLLCALFIISCHSKTPVIATRTEQPPAPAKPATAAATTPSVVSEADMVAGETIYNGKCIKCHAAKPVDNWTVEQWKPILKSMVRKTKLDSIQTAQVTAWVNAHAKKN